MLVACLAVVPVIAAKDVSASIEEIRRNEKDPGKVFFVLGGSLFKGKGGVVDIEAAKQYLLAAQREDHAGGHWYMAAIEEEEDGATLFAMFDYLAAAFLFEKDPERYGEHAAEFQRHRLEQGKRIEHSLDPSDRALAYAMLKDFREVRE